MSKNCPEIPFTEIVERVIQLARLREDVKDKVRGLVNDVYTKDIPRKEDWNFLITRSYLPLEAEYAVGTISANTGSTTAQFDSTATLTQAMNGRRLKINGNDYLYDYTYVNANTGTISPSLVGSVNISGAGYSLFRNVYSLAHDFEKFPKNGGLHIFRGGRRKVIPEKGYDYYTDQFNATPTDNQEYCKVIGRDTAGNFQVEVVPPSKTAGATEYDYFKRLSPMRETTAGTVTIAAGGNGVVGSGTKFLEAKTGDYLRVDGFGVGADSEWYRIDSISTNDSATLSLAFGQSSASASTYTICSSPDMPTMMHNAIILGALTMVSADQNDPMVAGYKQEYANVLTDGKRIYKTRLYREDIPTIAEEYHFRR